MKTATTNYTNKIKNLTRFFSLSEEGAYTFAVADDELLQQNISQNLLQLAANQNTKLAVANIKDLASKDLAPIAALRHFINEQDHLDGLIITNLYGLWLSKLYPDFLMQLNFVREALLKLNVPILFWINNEMLPLLSRHAKDLYDQRHNFNLYFTETANRPNELQADQFVAIERSKVVKDKKQYESRLKLLFNQLEKAKSSGDSKTDLANDIVIQILDIYRTLPQLDGAFSRLFEEYENYFNLKDAWTNYILAYGLNSVDRNKAEAYYLKSIDLNRKYLQVNPKHYVSFFAESLNDLANIQSEKNELDKAEQSYKEALSVKRKFPGKKFANYFSDFAAISNNFATLLMEKHRFKEAEATYLEVLKIKKHLIKDNDEKDASDYAMTLNNLGGLYLYTGQLDKAEINLQKALSIYRKLKIPKFNNMLFDVANNLNNLGLLYQNSNELEKAEKFHKEALGVRREMVEIEPSTYLPCIADSLNNLGTLYRKVNKFEKARKFYEEALEIRIQLGKDQPSNFEIQLADTYLCLSNLFRYNKPDKILSLQHAKEAASLYLKYAATVPHAKKWLQTAEDNIQYWAGQA